MPPEVEGLSEDGYEVVSKRVQCRLAAVEFRHRVIGPPQPPHSGGGSALPGCPESSLGAAAEGGIPERPLHRAGIRDARRQQRGLRDVAAAHLAASGPVLGETPAAIADNRWMHRRAALRRTPGYATESGCL